MKIKMGQKFTGISARSTCLTLLVLVLTVTFTLPVFAFQFASGDLEGSLDSTLSYGLAWRMDDQDPAIYGISNGGNSTALSYNGDDGNLNYDEGDLISNTVKITSDLVMQYNDFGLFLRGTAFYDFENNDADRARTELTDEALDMVGKDAELLDAYVTYDFKIGDTLKRIIELYHTCFSICIPIILCHCSCKTSCRETSPRCNNITLICNIGISKS